MKFDVDATASTVVEDAPFFAPAASDLLDGLIGEYGMRRRQCEQVAAIAAGDLGNALHYFLCGNQDERAGRFGTLAVERLFKLDGAVAALNAAYWSKALALTDVLDCMPQKRRDEWNTSIRECTTPDFTEEAVRPTIEGLLAAREKFFAERVDGIFRGLSGEHVTNAPEAFGKRMIIARVLSSYGNSEHSTCGLINDLRCVIAKFMGRDEPKYWASGTLVNLLKGRWGEWVPVDGGALRIRLYMKGTAHLEVHPDMAWRLNCVLARLYPMAIPAQFRERPKRKAKAHELMKRPLPFAVLEVLASLEPARRRVPNDWQTRSELVPNALSLRCGDRDKQALHEAESIIQAIGGVKVPQGWYQFDYRPTDVVREIVVSGCIPDQVSHQFYPTPRKLALLAVELAEIGEADLVLEPSAGHGDLADVLPKERTTCVEVSGLRCDILRARGFNATQADFIAWAEAEDAKSTRFDRVVMNPPFADGRARSHLEHAASLVSPGGRLVAILPEGMRGNDCLPGFEHSWSKPYPGEFAGTSVAVVFLVADRRAS